MNKIISIPANIFNDQTTGTLNHLNISGNQLKDIPDSLFKLEKLKFLDLSNNHLTFLPDSVGEAKSLVELRVVNNSLEKLPETFGGIENIEVLDLK